MNDLLNDEHRGGWLGMPRKYSVIDLGGAALGGYMIYMGTREMRRATGWQGLLAVALGGVMIWIHTQRFFYAPQDQRGFIKLAQEMQLTQTDLDRIRPLLPPANVPALSPP